MFLLVEGYSVNKTREQAKSEGRRESIEQGSRDS